MWNITSITDFESEGEDPLNTYKTVELSQEEDTYYDDFLIGASEVTFQMMQHPTLRDELCKEYDLDHDDIPHRGNYCEFKVMNHHLGY